MPDDSRRLFDAVVEQALGESLESVMRKFCAACERGDGDRMRLIQSTIAGVVTLGTHAVVAEISKRRGM